MEEVCIDDDCLESETEIPKFVLRSSVFLPSQLCDAILAEFSQQRIELTNSVLHMFTNRENCLVRNLDIHDSTVSDRYLLMLMKHKPAHLNVFNCPLLTSQSLLSINMYGENLVSLKLGTFWGLFSDLDLANEGKNNSELFRLIIKHGPRLPQLRQLTMHDIEGPPPSRTAGVLRWFVRGTPKLTLLDLSGCDVNIEDLDMLVKVPNLSKLILHNVRLSKSALLHLAKLKNLQ